jgi:Do/DeqQ family serine protease
MRPWFLFLLTTGLFSLQACNAQSRDRDQQFARDASRTPPLPTRSAAAGQVQSYADIVSRVSPAVVTIRSERRVRAPERFPFSFSDPFRDFFGLEPDERQSTPRQRIPRGDGGAGRVQRGLGSGVLVRADGYCLTNHHVVDGAEDISVELQDGRRLKAKLIGSDPPSDLAVLKIDASGLPTLTLGNSDDVRVGDVTLAVGNPLGVGQTVTMGIISAKNRTTGLGDGNFEDFIQTDAPINQGNSGGALVNTAGELIGINSQILSPTGGSIGIGFAIPSNMARNVMDQLISTGKVRRGQLGVGIQPLTPEIASSLGITNTQGILINSVTPGSPAERAGLARGDIITALNGQPVTDTNSLRNRIAGAGPGADVRLTVVRDGRERQVNVRLAEFTAANAPSSPDSPRGESGGARLGIGVQPLTPELASRLRLRANEGLVISEIDPGGAAADAGLIQGDVIVEANRKPMRSVSDLETVVRGGGARPILLLINRGGQTVYITVTPKSQ